MNVNCCQEEISLGVHNERSMKHDVPQKREQDLGGLKGLSLDGTPTRRGSLEAFCRQKRLSSDAACDTCKEEEKLGP